MSNISSSRSILGSGDAFEVGWRYKFTYLNGRKKGVTPSLIINKTPIGTDRRRSCRHLRAGFQCGPGNPLDGLRDGIDVHTTCCNYIGACSSDSVPMSEWRKIKKGG